MNKMGLQNFAVKIMIKLCFMKSVVKIFFVLLLIVITSSCVKEGHVMYTFMVYTEKPITVRLSSWGGYTMYVNGAYDSNYKFHEVVTIDPYSYLGFTKSVGDYPSASAIPASLTPAWEYIIAIECEGVSIPKEYFKNPQNWEIQPAFQINGTFTDIRLDITAEVIEQFRQNE